MRPPSSGSSGLRQSAASNTTPSPGLSGASACASAGSIENAALRHPRHPPHEHAAMARRAPAHHRLMIGAGEEMRPEAARVDLLELEFGDGAGG